MLASNCRIHIKICIVDVWLSWNHPHEFSIKGCSLMCRNKSADKNENTRVHLIDVLLRSVWRNREKLQPWQVLYQLHLPGFCLRSSVVVANSIHAHTPQGGISIQLVTNKDAYCWFWIQFLVSFSRYMDHRLPPNILKFSIQSFLRPLFRRHLRWLANG